MGEHLKSFREFECGKRHHLVEEIYRLGRAFPKKETYALTIQSACCRFNSIEYR